MHGPREFPISSEVYLWYAIPELYKESSRIIWVILKPLHYSEAACNSDRNPEIGRVPEFSWKVVRCFFLFRRGLPGC